MPLPRPITSRWPKTPSQPVRSWLRRHHPMNELSTELNVAEWHRQIAPLADAASNAERLLAEIEGPLGTLYNQAEAAGDEQALGNVMAVWEKSQAIAAQIPPF